MIFSPVVYQFYLDYSITLQFKLNYESSTAETILFPI